MLLIDIYRYIKKRADKRPVYLKNFVDQSHHHGARTSEPSVEIIIPTRDKVELLRECVESIFEKTTYKNFRVTIVDNQSGDSATHTYLGELETRGVKILKYPHKFNYSAICNFAVGSSNAAYVCFLNNDTRVISKQWLSSLVDHARFPNIGLVGSVLFYPNGKLQHIGIAQSISGLASHPYLGDDYLDLDNRIIESCFEVTGVTFAAAMMCANTYREMGGLDESFKVGFNDVDLSLRLQSEGYSVVLCTCSKLIHLESQTRHKPLSILGFRRVLVENFRLYMKHPKILEKDSFFSR